MKFLLQINGKRSSHAVCRVVAVVVRVEESPKKRERKGQALAQLG